MMKFCCSENMTKKIGSTLIGYKSWQEAKMIVLNYDEFLLRLKNMTLKTNQTRSRFDSATPRFRFSLKPAAMDSSCQ
jgi:hypothetical protein